MKKIHSITILALAATVSFFPLPRTAFADSYMPGVGGFATDGSVFVGYSGDTQIPIFTTADDAPDLLTWSDATDYCGNSHESGHKDWRLPTKYELQLMYQNRKKGALNGSFNKSGGPTGWYWSSSEADGGQVSTMRFSNGEENVDYKDDKSTVRCVRSPTSGH